MGTTLYYNEQLDVAVKVPVLQYGGYLSEHRPDLLQSATALMFLVNDEYTYGNVDSARHEKIMSNLRVITSGGHEPCGDPTHYWHYPVVSSAIALAKRTSTIWSELTEDEIARLDFIMWVFALGSNFISNDKNNYRTGLTLRGDLHKSYGPNFRLSLVGPIIACADYFGGADALDEMFKQFDYDSFIDQMENFGFTNMLKVWTTPSYEHDGIVENNAKTLLMNGGEACVREKSATGYNFYYGGEGEGVRTEYLYNGARADSVDIICKLVYNTFSGGAIKSRVGVDTEGNARAFIVDGSTSPYEGLDGMMLEFDTTDASLRSDGNYCEVDFIMITSLLLLSKVTGKWNEKHHTALYTKMWNGINDLFYKLSVGYRSYSNLRTRTAIATNMNGYPLMKAAVAEFMTDPAQL